jgi:2-polyprenyl-6-methoxyphenol hydroxylase-like FAD-dependent oxidoreductase
MLIQNKRIAIIGAGPGGLTLARLLQMQGAKVKVYERDENKEARQPGATLDLHKESGLKALDAAGLMHAFQSNYRPGADKMRIVDQHGVIHFDQHLEDKEDSFEDDHYRPEIDRGPLRTLLMDSLKPNTIVWDSQLRSLQPLQNGWRLVFINGATEEADLVIAADGANSKIRPFITSIKPFYSGVTIVEGLVYESEKNAPAIHKLLKGGKLFAMGGNKTLIVSSKGDGSLVFYLGIKTNENWTVNSAIDFKNANQVYDWFKKEFEGWDSLWDELFINDSISFIPRPQYCMPLDQTWEALPSITMIGDAAHVMPPYAGEGANMAMLDALELSECLTSTKYQDLRSAIEAYEIQMRKRASEAAKMTLENTEYLHSPNALKGMVEMFKSV